MNKTLLYFFELLVALLPLAAIASGTTNGLGRPASNLLYCAYVRGGEPGRNGYCYFNPQISSTNGQSRLFPTIESFKKAVQAAYTPPPLLLSDPKWYPSGANIRALTKKELEYLGK